VAVGDVDVGVELGQVVEIDASERMSTIDEHRHVRSRELVCATGTDQVGDRQQARGVGSDVVDDQHRHALGAAGLDGIDCRHDLLDQLAVRTV